MRCSNNFKDDRICDLCKSVNNDKYEECKAKYDKEIMKERALKEVKDTCRHKYETFEEYHPYTECTITGSKCSPNYQCIKYIPGLMIDAKVRYKDIKTTINNYEIENNKITYCLKGYGWVKKLDEMEVIIDD